MDLFDKPSTCAKVWDRLLTGVVMDALEANSSAAAAVAEPADLKRLLGLSRASAREPAAAVGAGREFRSNTDSDTHASALWFQESVLHGSVVVAS
jgi:hypothetical protein